MPEHSQDTAKWDQPDGGNIREKQSIIDRVRRKTIKIQFFSLATLRETLGGPLRVNYVSATKERE